MKDFADKHPLLVGIVLVILILNGLTVNSDRVIGPTASEPLQWIAILTSLISIASVFGLLAHVITQAKKRKPPVDVEKWEQVHKTGKWKFAFRRTLPVIPLLIIGLFAWPFITSGATSISLGAIGTFALLIAIFSIGIFFISAAIWDNEDAEFRSAKKKEKADQPNS